MTLLKLYTATSQPYIRAQTLSAISLQLELQIISSLILKFSKKYLNKEIKSV